MDGISVINNFIITGKHGKPILVDVHLPSTPGPHPVVVFSHGFKGFKDWGPFNLIAKHFAVRGMVFIKFNFAFNGTTPTNPFDFVDLEAFGNNNFTFELDDLESILDWLFDNQKVLNANLDDITLLGHSRGGGITILKGAEDSRVHKLVTWAPVADYSRHITKQEVMNWKETGVFFVENVRTGQMMPLYVQLYYDYIVNHRRFHIRNAVASLSKPILIAHGTLDDTIPFEHAEELYNLNPDMAYLLSVTNSGHTFGAAHPFEDKTLPPEFQLVVNETIKFILVS